MKGRERNLLKTVFSSISNERESSLRTYWVSVYSGTMLRCSLCRDGHLNCTVGCIHRSWEDAYKWPEWDNTAIMHFVPQTLAWKKKQTN